MKARRKSARQRKCRCGRFSIHYEHRASALHREDAARTKRHWWYETRTSSVVNSCRQRDRTTRHSGSIAVRRLAKRKNRHGETKCDDAHPTLLKFSRGAGGRKALRQIKQRSRGIGRKHCRPCGLRSCGDAFRTAAQGRVANDAEGKGRSGATEMPIARDVSFGQSSRQPNDAALVGMEKP